MVVRARRLPTTLGRYGYACQDIVRNHRPQPTLTPCVRDHHRRAVEDAAPPGVLRIDLDPGNLTFLGDQPGHIREILETKWCAAPVIRVSRVSPSGRLANSEAGV